MRSELDSTSPLLGMVILSVVALALACCVLIALAVPAYQSAHSRNQRMVCPNHLKQIGLAMHNYHDHEKLSGFPKGFRRPRNISW